MEEKKNISDCLKNVFWNIQTFKNAEEVLQLP
jgi:hypothetical protein